MNRLHEQAFIVLEQPESGVARLTEKSSDLAGGVVMVNGETLRGACWHSFGLAANGANIALTHEARIIFSRCDPVFSSHVLLTSPTLLLFGSAL